MRSPNWRLVAATSFAGVRGAITLAGVIIVSLVIASIALPILLKGLTLPPEPSRQAEEDSARVATAEAAIRAVERHQHALGETHGDPDLYAAAGARVMGFYRERIEGLGEGMAGEARAQERLASELRLVGIQAERARLLELGRARAIGSETARKLTRELDLAETRHRG